MRYVMYFSRLALVGALLPLAFLALPGLAAGGTLPPGPPAVETVQGFIREYALADLRSGPAIVAVDEDDTVWTALAKSGQLARFLNGSVEVFDIGADSRPVGIAVGTRKNGHPGVLWIAASFDNKILRFETATQKVQEFPIEGEDAWPFNIAIAPDGMLWFSQRASGRVGRLDPATGEVVHFDPPTPGGGPAGLAVDKSSGIVWFTEGYADRLGRLDPATGEIEEFVMGESSNGNQTGPAGMAIDAAGGVWFAKLEGKLGYLPPGGREIELLDVPAEARRPAGLAVAGNGDVWALALDGNLLLRYRPSTHVFTQFPIPSGQPDAVTAYPPQARTSRPFGIGFDRQGNLWFSEQYRGQLGVLDTAAPEIRVESPGKVVRTLGVPVTYSAVDRVAGVAEVEVRIGGEKVELRQGALNLSRLAPGFYDLEVAARDHAGNLSTVRTRFEFAPGPLALSQLLGGLKPQDDDAKALQKEWLEAAKKVRRGADPEVFEGLRGGFRQGSEKFREFPERVLLAILDYQEKGGGGETVGVDLLDQPPYFQPAEIVVSRGDTVSWRYEPPIEGHSLAKSLHRIVIENGSEVARSGLMRSGESFSFQFAELGRFVVRDTYRPDAVTVVEVVTR